MLAGFVIAVILFCYLFPRPIRDGLLAFAALLAMVMIWSPSHGEDASSMSRLRAQMNGEPGSYAGWVPGGTLKPGDRVIRDEEVADVPDFPIEDACRASDRRTGGNWYSMCIKDAQRDYDYLKAVWPMLGLTSRKVCFGTSARDLTGYEVAMIYRRMVACADVRLGAEDQLREQTTLRRY